MDQQITLQIKWGTKSYTIKISENATLLSFRQELQAQTGLPPDLQKLMYKGTLQGNEKTLKELKVTNNAKLMLVGAPLKQVMAVATAQETAKELEKDPSDVKGAELTKQLPPFWYLPPFTATLADPFLDGVGVGALKRGGMLSIYNFIFKRVARKASDLSSRGSIGLNLFTDADVAHLQTVAKVLEDCAEWTQAAQEVEASDKFLEILEAWRQKIEKLEEGKNLLVPGGWEGLNSNGTIYHVIQHTGPNDYAFITCNPASGLEYHQQGIFSSPKHKYQTCIRIDHIPKARILDLGFWSLFFTLWIKEPVSEYHRIEVIYDVLLPWLSETAAEGDNLLSRSFTEATIKTQKDVGIDWRTKCRSNGSSGIRAVWEAVRYILRTCGLSVPQLKQLSFALRREMLVRAGEDLITRFASKYDDAADAILAANSVGIIPPPDDESLRGDLATGLDNLENVIQILSQQGSLVRANGQAVDIKKFFIKKRVIGLYFSAHWSSPCQSFTKQLSATYQALQKQNKDFEIIFVSLDRDAESFKKYFSEMPWVGVPFEQDGLRHKLETRAKVKGIPTLVLYNPDGSLLSRNGRTVILDDPDAKDFPWVNANMVNFDAAAPKLKNLRNKKGESVNPHSFFNKVVGLYFSASWCPPCQGFTPILKTTYKVLKEQKKDFEIIYVSSDKDEESYKKYYGTMPWLAVAFEDRQARAELAKLFNVKGIPTLVLFDEKGGFLTSDGRKVISMDQQGEHFPWKDIASLEEAAGVAEEKNPVLNQVDLKFLQIGCQQLSTTALKEHRSGRLDAMGLRRLKSLIDSIEGLISVVPQAPKSGGLPPLLQVSTEVGFTHFPGAELLVDDAGSIPDVEKYAGKAWVPEYPVVANLLGVPDSVKSIEEVLGALEACENVCERMLQRAAQSGTSSRTVLQIQVIALITTLCLETIPIPPPIDAAPEVVQASIWQAHLMTQEHQKFALRSVQKLALTFAAMWQGVENPTRGFDAERSLVSMAMLALFDYIVRMKPTCNAGTLHLTDLLASDGGYAISSTCCPNQRNLELVAATMELVNPVHTVPRSAIIDYFTSIRRNTRHAIFPFRQEEIITDESHPTFSIEILKYGSCVVFMRKLMERHNLRFEPMPGTPEMVILMQWFTGPKSKLAEEAPEFGLMRDMAAVYKFLVTMQTRESELLQRCAGKGNARHWSRSLSADDSHSQNRAFRFSTAIPDLKWELANVRGQDLNMADLICRFGERVLYFGEGPVVHSPADLSAIIEKPRPSEDDVLHSTKLPKFGDTLRREESEMLCSYLTVEYARIPLVVGFFASRERTTYLFNPQLRDLLRAVLFEGGTWVSPNFRESIDCIPVRRTQLQHDQFQQRKLMDAKIKEEVSVLGTPQGNLLNELHCSPNATLNPLLTMFNAIQNLRNSTVHSADASFTLFLMELTIDVQSYIAYAIKEEESEKQRAGDKPWDFGSKENLQILHTFYEKVRLYLQKDIAPILQRWKLEASEAGDRATLSVVHSYLALLWSHPLEFTQDTAIHLLGHVAFVRNKHGFGLRRGRSDLMWTAGDDDMSPRDRLLRFLQAYGIDTQGMGDSVLDEYVNLNKKGPLVLRVGQQSVIVPPLHRIQNLEELPPADVPEDRIFALLQTHRRALVGWLVQAQATSGDLFDGTLNEIMKIALDNPDFTYRGWADKGDGWFEALDVQLKIDVQSAEIFWRNDVLKPVPDSMTQFIDFKTLWDRPQFQCGLVRRDQHRHWVNIMDLPYELQEWTQEDIIDQGVFTPVHSPTPPRPDQEPEKDDPGVITFCGIEYSRPFELYSEVPHPQFNERWATEFVRPVLLHLFPNTPLTQMKYKLLMPTTLAGKDSRVIRMMGRETLEEEKKLVQVTWKEVVIYREPQVVHVFNIVSHGRRMWRSQVYSSNLQFSLQGLPPDEAAKKSPPPRQSRNAGGDWKQSAPQGPSLVIIHRNNQLGGSERFAPSRLLQGIIPSVLLETFHLWQGDDGVIRGEPHVASQWFGYRLEISFKIQNGTKIASVVRSNINSAPTPIKKTNDDLEGSFDNTGLRRSNKKSSDNLTALLKMGFSRSEAVFALQKNDYDTDRAASYLLDSSTKEEREGLAGQEGSEQYRTVNTATQEDTDELIENLVSQGFPRRAVRYAFDLFDSDADMAHGWLTDRSNEQTIQNLAKGDQMEIEDERSVGAELYLACLTDLKSGSSLHRLATMLTRIEDMSHILVWTNRASLVDLENSAGTLDTAQIAVIELPRLKVKFQPKTDDDGQVRLHLLEQAGWFVTDSFSQEDKTAHPPGTQFLAKLLEGLPNCLVLENSSHDLQLFVPNYDVHRPVLKEDPFSTELLYNRGSLGWQQVMESRFYLYLVHPSKTFLMMPSLSASLYMALHRLLNRQYADCFKLLEACHVDVDFTTEEQWVFDEFERAADDLHPDAHACRLKLSLAVLFSENKVKWKVHVEMVKYLEKLEHVSADCLLTYHEERQILENCQRDSGILGNRLVYIESEKKSEASVSVPPKRLAGQPWLKLASLSREYMESHGQRITKLQYDPPAAGSLTDVGAFDILWEGKFISDEETGPIGFLFLYEILRGDFKLGLLKQDVSRSMGELLLRYMQLKSARWGREAIQEGEREYEGSWQMVGLACLLLNPNHKWPTLPKDPMARDLLKIGCNIHRLNARERAPIKTAFLDIIESTTRVVMGEPAYALKMKQFSTDLRISKEFCDFIVPVVNDGSLKKQRAKIVDTSCSSRTLSAFSLGAFTMSQADVLSFAKTPLDIIDLSRFVTFIPAPTSPIDKIPFDVESHPMAQSIVAKDMIARVSKDISVYSDQAKKRTIPTLKGLLDQDIAKYFQDPSSLESSPIFETLDKLSEELNRLEQKDSALVASLIESVNISSNQVDLSDDLSPETMSRCRFKMEQYASQRAKLDVNLVIASLLDQEAAKTLLSINPYLKDPNMLALQAATILFYVSRINQANRALNEVVMVKTLLTQLKESTISAKLTPRGGLGRSTSSLNRSAKKDTDNLTDAMERLRYGALSLATSLTAGRYFVHPSSEPGKFTYDPRFLIFEYVFNLLIRKRQVEMVNSFMKSVASGDSRVQQMIMGAGKTTVVGPLLTLILADGKQLVTHVMPTALLEQSRNILRSRFSAITLKSVYTLNFERAVEDSQELVERLRNKLESAIINRDLIVAAPESLKSVMLKFVEQLHSIELFSNRESNFKPGSDERSNREYMALQKQMVCKSEMADHLVKVLDIWKDGVLIMDEVDVLLHPLKSELNFPIGFKEAIDLAGVRWDLPIHLFDAVFYHSQQSLCGEIEIFESAEKKLGMTTQQVLDQICAAINSGYKTHALQRNPHIVLLDTNWYDLHMKEKMAFWAFLGIYRHIETDSKNVPIPAIIDYIKGGDKSLYREVLESNLYPESLKLLNLTADWITSLFPHCLSKINRVAYGILSPEDIATADPRTPQSRLLMAVPFVGKDVPSRCSEFAHPDALIGLTVMAYRYEGMRLDDLSTVVNQLKQDYSRQVGPREQRPASILFQKWLHRAQEQNCDLRASTKGGNVLPLSLFQPGDKKQLRALFTLVRHSPDIVLYYLRQHVFPACMNFQATKVSASGHELGSNILFSKRIGFSGTPSNLLPKDLGDCEYEPGSDGKILNTLTSPIVTSYSFLEPEWNAKYLLQKIATEPNSFHALIDTGALITGMDNQEVAHYLLLHLPKWYEGVVYLDRQDRQMILLRNSGRSMLLGQCGVRPDRRFTFYDQVHTTGMDIKQAASARAVLTLGKDMTFRDYAQGAYRMRGIGTGQTIHLYIIPEVKNLIEEEIGHTIANKQRPTKRRKVFDEPMELASNPLLDVPNWLFINSMRMETLQFVKLSSQELFNVWRKRALFELTKEVKFAQQRGDRGAARLGRFRITQEPILCDSISLFREPLGFSVPDQVPTKEFFHKKLSNLAVQHQVFVANFPELEERVKSVLENISSVELQDVEFDKQNRDAHVVREQEQEAQEEAEEEAEQEAERESRYSREDEQPNPWDVSLLAKIPSLKRGEEAFYPFCEFQVRKEQPILPFPPNLLLSDNFFRPSWISTGDRRLKNVTFLLEWIPDLANETRYLCALSLAEGETIRRILHTKHLVLNTSHVALRSLEGGIIDQTVNFFNEAPPKDDVLVGVQAFHFINSEMYYEQENLEFLERALAGTSLDSRREFFMTCLRLRRHERNLWDDTPLAKIFTPQSEWHMIRARAMVYQISQAIKKTIKNRKKPSWWNPYDILKRHDHDEDGNLTKDELMSAFEEFNLNFSPADYDEVSKLIPKNRKGHYPITDFAETFSIMSNAEVEAILVTKVYSTDKPKSQEKWTCKVCSYAHNPKWVVICESCQHDILGEPVVNLNSDEWSCGKCSLRNKKRDWFCEACWNARPSRFSQ